MEYLVNRFAKKYAVEIVFLILVLLWFALLVVRDQRPDESFLIKGTVTRVVTVGGQSPFSDYVILSVAGDGRAYRCNFDDVMACALVAQGDEVTMKVASYGDAYDVKELSINAP